MPSSKFVQAIYMSNRRELFYCLARRTVKPILFLSNKYLNCSLFSNVGKKQYEKCLPAIPGLYYLLRYIIQIRHEFEKMGVKAGQHYLRI